MKSIAGVLSLSLLLLAGCTQPAAESSSFVQSEARPAEAMSRGIAEPFDEPENFGALMYVDGEDILLRQGMTFHWDEIGSSLDEATAGHTYTSDFWGGNSMTHWQGRRIYEMDGYLLQVIMHGDKDTPEEDLGPGFSFVILTDEKHVLESGLHVGMPLEDAQQIAEQHGQPLCHMVEDVAAAQKEAGIAADLMAWHEFPEGFFAEYPTCLVFAYVPNPESLGRSLCLYANEDGIVQAITSAYWTLP